MIMKDVEPRVQNSLTNKNLGPGYFTIPPCQGLKEQNTPNV